MGASVSGGRVVGGSVSGAVVAGVVASVVGAAVSVGVGAAPQALQESKTANVSRQIKRLFMVFPPNFVNIPIIPLCNPGIKAITAAVEPADTDYYYFLTDETATEFYYAETYSQHLANGKKAGIM